MPIYKTEALSQGPLHMNKNLVFSWKQDFKEHMFYISRMGKIGFSFFYIHFFVQALYCMYDLTGHHNF